MTHALKTPQKVLIWDRDGLPKYSDDFVVLWKGYSQNSNDQELSIPAWIAQNQDFVRDKYLSWVRKGYQRLKSNSELYKKIQLGSVINYFQLTPFMEMNLFDKSPQIASILRLIAFEAWADEMTLVSIEYAGDDGLLSKTFEDFAARNQIPYRTEVSTTPYVNVFQRSVFWGRLYIGAIKSPVWIFLKWMKSLPLHGLHVKFWKKNSHNLTFYSYYAHFPPTNASNSEFKSAYWGDLPRYVKSIGIHSNWIHISPVSDGFLDALEKRVMLKKSSSEDKSQIHLALESFLSLKIMISTIVSWLKIRSHAQDIKQFLTSQMNGRFDFWPYFESEFERYLLGVGLIDNLLMFQLVRSSVETNPLSYQSFYLYEGQPWEKVLNSVSTQIENNLPIAVQHSTVRFWDLRYFQHSLERFEENELETYFPRKVIVNGDLAISMLGNRPQQQELIKLESLRYKRNPPTQQGFMDLPGRVSPLILGSFLQEENDFILRLLDESAANLAGIEFIFKPHPLSTKPFLSRKIAVSNSSHDLWSLFQGATHVLIGSSTSAVIEVIEAHIPFVIFSPPSLINLSPLNGVVGVEFLNAPHQLIKFLTAPSQEFINTLKVGDLVTEHAELVLWRRFIQQLK